MSAPHHGYDRAGNRQGDNPVQLGRSDHSDGATKIVNGEPSSTKTKLLTEALRLFGEQGYAATTVADIEQAAGLAPGRGGLYRHFASKKDLLVAAVQHEAQRNRELISTLTHAAAEGDDSESITTALAWAGLQRLRDERDLTRLLLRDLKDFPELLEEAADSDIRPVHAALAGWLAPNVDESFDAKTLAAVLAGAITHFWQVEDVFGRHPNGISAEEYIATLSRLCRLAFKSGPA